MDPTISQLLGSIDGKVSGVASELAALRGDVQQVREQMAGAARDAAAVARDVERMEERQAELDRELRAVQRRLDEQEGARRAAGALGVSGLATGVGGAIVAVWTWITGGGGGVP